MQKVVVDTSVVAKWFFPEKGRTEALKLKDQHLHGKISICTRDLLLYELTSVFKNYSLIKIEEADFSLAASALSALRLEIFPLEFGEMSDLFSLSYHLDVSVYDCSFLLLAKRLRTALYTADKKLHLKAKSLIPSFLI